MSRKVVEEKGGREGGREGGRARSRKAGDFSPDSRFPFSSFIPVSAFHGACVGRVFVSV